MGTRSWGATGHAGFSLFEMADNEKDRFRVHITAHNIFRIPPEFFRDICRAIGQYRATISIKEQSRPSKVRYNILRAMEAVRDAIDAIDQLDGNSRQLIAESEPDFNELQDEWKSRTCTALESARRLAQEYPKRGGRLLEPQRVDLAESVAHAVQNHLGVDATTTKEGLYENVLAETLAIATGAKEANSVHDLACRAIKRIKKEAGKGVSEPPAHEVD